MEGIAITVRQGAKLQRVEREDTQGVCKQIEKMMPYGVYMYILNGMHPYGDDNIFYYLERKMFIVFIYAFNGKKKKNLPFASAIWESYADFYFLNKYIKKL